MSRRIPDELLQQILRELLSVPIEEFCSYEDKFSFVTSPHSTASDVLLVAKRWWQVGTPLLFETVTLRTAAQVKAFAATFKKDPSLGRHVRKLRLESGFGLQLAMKTIVSACGSSIQVLYLYVGVLAGDNVDGLLHLLPSINPNQIVLFGDGRSNCKAAVKLDQTLGSCISTWSNLISVHFRDYDPFYLRSGVMSSLGKSKSLRNISLKTPKRWSHFASVIENIDKFASQSKSLVSICFRGELDGSRYQGMNFNVPVSVKTLDLLQVDQIPDTPPFPEGIADALPDSVLSRILAFATHLQHPDDLNFNSELWQASIKNKVNVTRTSLCLVSKKFKTLAQPFLLDKPIFRSPSSVEKYCGLLQSNPQFSRRMRVFHAPHVLSTATIIPVLSSLNLEHIKACISAPVRKGQQAQLPADAWESFQNVRSLELSCYDSEGHKEVELMVKPVLSSFPRLRRLGTRNFGAQAFDVFAITDLPCLEEVHLDLHYITYEWNAAEEAMRFLYFRGRTIKTAQLDGSRSSPALQYGSKSILDLLPNLETLKCAYGVPQLDRLMSEDGCCPSLRCIILTECHFVRPAAKKPDLQWDSFVSNLRRTNFPALEEVHVDVEWPSTEHLAKRTFWLHRMQTLKALGIGLFDLEGIRWDRDISQ